MMSQMDTGVCHSGQQLEEFDDVDEIMSQIDMETINPIQVMNGRSDGVDFEDQNIEVEVPEELLAEIEMEQTNDGADPELPAALLEQYAEAMTKILPPKSASRYCQAYEVFRKWQTENHTSSFAEKVLMCYFNAGAKKYKPPTMWSMYSMLKKTILVKNNIDISKYSQLIAFLKMQSDGYQSKKSNVFSPEEVQKFISVAPDQIYLGMKVK